MHPTFTKSAVVDDLTARLAARRRQACERRVGYQRLARAIVGQPQAASWSVIGRRPQPRPIQAAA